ncbi:MAG TPA: DoxX family membrane protein [Candidatus Saccharimonadales bacterium]
MFQKIINYPQLPSLLIRIGLAIIFTYAAVASFVSPREWIGFLPQPLTAIFPAEILLQIFSVVELLLAAWLLSGVYVRFAALFAAFMLAGIVVSNFQLFSISFRDIALIFAALALAAMSHNAAKEL